MSNYSLEVQRIFNTIKPPFPHFIVDLVEYDSYLSLRVYKSVIESLSEPQKIACAEYLYQVRDAIRQTGAKCHIQGVEHDPPARRK